MLLPNANAIKLGETLKIVTEAEQPSRTYAVNWHTGRVEGFADGLEAMRQAIYKILMTERFDYLIYSWDYGVEMNRLLGQSAQEAEGEIERVISEALLADARITAVTNFRVTAADRRHVAVEFTAETIFGAVEINTGELL